VGVKYLWDTNIVIYFLQKLFPSEIETWIDSILEMHQPCISVITEIELMCWKVADKNDQALLQRFIQEITVVDLEKSIKIKTAEIRKSTRIKLPDAIIAATALVHKCTLLTRNYKDFANIPELNVINPFELN
jgi:predicted nucleic acid-binding protein